MEYVAAGVLLWSLFLIFIVIKITYVSFDFFPAFKSNHPNRYDQIILRKIRQSAL